MKKLREKIFLALLALISVLLLTGFLLAYGCVHTELVNDRGTGVSFSEVLYGMGNDNDAHLLWQKIKYKYFGIFDSDTVQKGKNGFLFPRTRDGFDYEADRQGRYAYDEASLEKIKKTLEARADTYARFGTEYRLYIIPNVQTVYPEYLGEYDMSVTRASTLLSYLEQNGINAQMLDLSDYDGEYPLYDNTQDNMNMLGAYEAYTRLAEGLPDSLKQRMAPLTLEGIQIKTAYTSGRGLTEDTYLSGLIRNYDVYFSTSNFKESYTSGRLDTGELKTSLTDTTLSDITSVLVQIPSEKERELLLPFLSASFSNVVYSHGLGYDEELTGELLPDCVITVLREDELDRLLDGDDIRSFEDTDSGEKTPKPRIIAKANKDRNTVLIFGSSESGAVVTGEGDGETSRCVCRDGLFILQIEMYSFSEQLKIKASTPGKKTSDAIYITVKRSVVSPSAQPVVYGGDMLYYSPALVEYKGEGLFTEKELEGAKVGAENFVKKLRQMTGKDTRLILLIAPDPVSVYGQSSTESIKNGMSDVTRAKQLSELFNGSDYVTAPYLADIMRENKDKGKLYYQTDTHWTELGAYFGYEALISEVGKYHKNVTPYPLNMLNIETVSSCGGDLAGYLGVADTVYENVPYLQKSFTSHINEMLSDTDTIGRAECTGSFTTSVDGADLPSAYIMRDSYSAQLYPLLGEHFSCAYYEAMWNYTPSLDKIEQLSADYVIYIITERNISSLSS